MKKFCLHGINILLLLLYSNVKNYVNILKQYLKYSLMLYLYLINFFYLF